MTAMGAPCAMMSQLTSAEADGHLAVTTSAPDSFDSFPGCFSRILEHLRHLCSSIELVCYLTQLKAMLLFHARCD